MSKQSQNITEELVEQLAIIAYEGVRLKNCSESMPSWTGAGAMTRFQMKQEVLGVLTMVVPVLLEQGWMPPAEAAVLKETIDRVSKLFQGVYISHGHGITENVNATIKAVIEVNKA